MHFFASLFNKEALVLKLRLSLLLLISFSLTQLTLSVFD